MRLLLVPALVMLMSGPAFAKTYVVDHGQSVISFTGTHAGKPFEGTFGGWSAEIVFDPENLEGSSLKATFDLREAKTGNAMFDGALPQGDWFHVKEHPQGVFQSTSILAKPDNAGYTATGDLTLRGITQPVAFDFIIEDLSAAPVHVQAEFPVDRLLFDIGKKSDGKAEWVSQTIEIKMDIKANATD